MVVFNEEKHTYTNPDTGELYTSATTVIGKFQKPFDTDKFARLVAKKHGVTAEFVKESWKKETQKACDYGSDIHKALELDLLGETDKITSEQRELYIDPLKSIWTPDIHKVTPEKVLWNHDYKVAGMTDVYVDDDSKHFSLFDFKTNKKFDFYSKYKDFMLAPLDHLTQCKFTTYALQLSLYAYMNQQLTGKKVNELAVLYYDRNAVKWTKYNVPYMKRDVVAMLDALN